MNISDHESMSRRNSKSTRLNCVFAFCPDINSWSWIAVYIIIAMTVIRENVCRKPETSGQRNLTAHRIAAAHERFSGICQVAPVCHVPPSIHASLAHLSPQPKRHVDRFSCFCRADYCDRQTDGQTNHATRSITIGRIYVRSTSMRPKMLFRR